MIRLGYLLQRLFSTFPNSWPGAGLLLLRLNLSFALFSLNSPNLFADANTVVAAQASTAVLGAVLLLAGLWTPVVGTLAALDELWIAFTLYYPDREATMVHAFIAVLAVSVAMLGPGAWSFDARLFGRKRFDMDRTSGRGTSL